MKLFSGALVATVLAAAFATGCSETPHRYSEIRPAIHVSPVQTMQVGESRRVAITSQNLVGARALRWDVSPTNGRIQVEQGANGQKRVKVRGHGRKCAGTDGSRDAMPLLPQPSSVREDERWEWAQSLDVSQLEISANTNGFYLFHSTDS